MSLDENIEAVYSYLKSQKIYLNKNNLSFQVKSHADSPSLLSFSDTLNFLGISNLAFNLALEDVENLPDSFLALLGEENQQPDLFHITKKGDYYLYRKEKKIVKATRKDLEALWKSVVLLAEEPEEKVDENKSKISTGSLITFLVIIILGSVYLFSHSLLLTLFGVLSSVGLFLSIEALKTELGIESKVSQRFCNIVVNADCGQVINSEKNEWLQKIKISDISLWFFCSQLMALFVFSVAGFTETFVNYMTFSLLLSSPITLYSIYFQYKIEKKWCLICLAIIVLTNLEFIFLLFFKTNLKFEALSSILFFIIFLIVSILVYLLKPVFIEKRNLSTNYLKQIRFSKDYVIFRNTLIKSETQFFEKEYILLGNRKSKHKISIVTSPTCEFCEAAHYVLDNIYKQFGQNLAISIRFNYYDFLSIETKNLYLRLGEIYETETEIEFLQALKYWFENKNLDDWFDKFGKLENPENIDMKFIEITNENLEKGLNFTPNIFLNQYNFPNQYDVENLEYFIADWIEDKEL